MGCAFLVWSADASDFAERPVKAAAAQATWRERGKWAVLGLLPSALLVAGTTDLTTDVASAPLLWVIPLALYLSAFILAFSPRAWIPARVTTLLLPALAGIALVVSWSAGDWRILAVAVLSTLWLGAYVSCRALYDTRPDAARLTDFYLWMSLGGVVGGALAALAAPMLFDSVLEWPIAVTLTLFSLPAGKMPSRPLLVIFAACVAITLLAAMLAGSPLAGRFVAAGLVSGLAAIALGRTSRTLMAVACIAIIVMGAAVQRASVVFADRSFYGMVRVLDTEDGQWRRFAHGTTMHGVQSRDPARALTPTGYYGPLTPIGSAMRALNANGRVHNVAILGLGVGTMACWKQPAQSWTFYEIDPLVVQVARDPRLFTFLSRCAPTSPVIVGDARLELAKQKPGAYDLILADAFSSDAVPTHLITREAMQLYLNSVSENGVILVHVSNRNLALADVAVRAAQGAGAFVVQRIYLPARYDYANFASQVVAIARHREDLAPLMADPAWTVSEPSAGRMWTDDYSNILEPMVERLQHPLRTPQASLQ